MFNQNIQVIQIKKNYSILFSFIHYIILEHINTKAYLKLFFIIKVKW